jgi:hypothetical protein
MFFLPAGIKKQGVAEKAAIIHAAGAFHPWEPGEDADKNHAKEVKGKKR